MVVVVVAACRLVVDKSNLVSSANMKVIMDLVVTPFSRSIRGLSICGGECMHVTFNPYEILLFFDGKGSSPDFH